MPPSSHSRKKQDDKNKRYYCTRVVQKYGSGHPPLSTRHKITMNPNGKGDVCLFSVLCGVMPHPQTRAGEGGTRDFKQLFFLHRPVLPGSPRETAAAPPPPPHHYIFLNEGRKRMCSLLIEHDSPAFPHSSVYATLTDRQAGITHLVAGCVCGKQMCGRILSLAFNKSHTLWFRGRLKRKEQTGQESKVEIKLNWWEMVNRTLRHGRDHILDALEVGLSDESNLNRHRNVIERDFPNCKGCDKNKNKVFYTI